MGSVAGNEGITAQAAEKNANIKNFLGEAFNYGIVANEYMQANHMQTNFAVKNYSLTQKTECGDNITDRGNKDIVFGFYKDFQHMGNFRCDRTIPKQHLYGHRCF